MGLTNDPYNYLEDTDGDKAIDFVLAANKMCLQALGDPTKTHSDIYSRVLKSLDSDERIPFVSKIGKDAAGSDVLYNLWKDSSVSVNGKAVPRESRIPQKSVQSSSLTTVGFPPYSIGEDYGAKQQ